MKVKVYSAIVYIPSATASTASTTKCDVFATREEAETWARSKSTDNGKTVGAWTVEKHGIERDDLEDFEQEYEVEIEQTLIRRMSVKVMAADEESAEQIVMYDRDPSDLDWDDASDETDFSYDVLCVTEA